MKKSKLFFALMLMSFCAIASDTTLVLTTKLGDIKITVPVEKLDNVVNELAGELALLANDGAEIAETINEKDPKSVMDWIVLVITGGLLPILVAFFTRFTRTVKAISNYFKNDSTLAIVAAISAILAAVFELIRNGYTPEFFNNWNTLFVFAFVGSMVFYEKVIKRFLGKTPKAEA